MRRRIVEKVAEAVAAGELPPGAKAPSVRELAAEVGCAPGTAALACAELRRAGVIAGPPRARAVVAPDGRSRARRLLAGGRVLRLAGSDDPALDALLRLADGAAVDRVEIAAGVHGSLHGLTQLARGEADAAAIHLHHAASDRYNDPFVRSLVGAEPILIVHLWRREQGFVVGPGNPHRIRGPRDLAGRAVAWRAPGSGSRLLLERLVREAGVEVEPPDPGRVAGSHRAVAAAVANGAADTGVAVRAAAGSAGLDFAGVTVEPFEIAVREPAMPLLEPLLEGLAEGSLRDELAALAGYDLASAGRIRRPK
ncbi:MAG TPA: substrate-binding domain-containing protein [Solirubrobacterales bacterium]|nr:substrate-binding domain-containing protein [Solirubrobacterales bacterium]